MIARHLFGQYIMLAANNEVKCAIITIKTKRQRLTMNELQATHGFKLLRLTKRLKVAKSYHSLQNHKLIRKFFCIAA